MNNSKIYLVLYYLCFIFTLGFVIYTSFTFNDTFTIFGTVMGNFDGSSILSCVFVLVVLFSFNILFSILHIKKKISNANILFPIFYLLFLIIMVVIEFRFNSILLIPGMQFSYYFHFVYIGYIILNIYSLLCLSSKKNKKSKA